MNFPSRNMFLDPEFSGCGRGWRGWGGGGIVSATTEDPEEKVLVTRVLALSDDSTSGTDIFCKWK